MSQKADYLKYKADRIAQLAVEFFEKYSLDDYAEFARDVVQRLYRRQDKLLQRGKEELWAAGIVYVLASINGVLRYKDSKFSADDIAEHFGLKKKSIASKAYSIKDILQLGKDDNYISKEYSNKEQLLMNFFQEMAKKSKMYYEGDLEAMAQKKKYLSQSLVLRLYIDGLPGYRKVVVPADLSVEDFTVIAAIGFFPTPFLSVFSITKDDEIYIYIPPEEERNDSEENIFSLPILDFLSKPGETCTINYEEIWKVNVNVLEIRQLRYLEPKYIGATGPMIIDEELSLAENLLLLRDEQMLLAHLDTILPNYDLASKQRIKNLAMNADVNYFNFVIKDILESRL